MKIPEIILPKLVLCLGFLDMRMQSSACQSWYFALGFGYEDAKLIIPNLVLCLGFSI